jgi:anti-sigma regulatory factor (Ser/Thr protein kinase)
MCWEGSRTFNCDPSAARLGRGFCADHLGSVLDISAASEPIEDAELVISELVTNAVNAGCADTQLRINLHRDHIRIYVADNGPGWPQIQRPDPEERHGRGLHIVETIADKWGVEATATGKQVWADVAIPATLTDGLDCHF